MPETVIKIENLKKQYRLGTISSGTLQGDIQSWWARIKGEDNPNSKIGEKVYGKNESFWALDGINLEIRKGEALGIIGANGAGKSTLLKILSRVTAPTEGDVYIKGRIASMLEVGTGFHPEMTGRENIYMNGAILGMSRREVDEKIEDIIAFSECGQFIDTPIKRYSSGMYVKLAFSVAAHLASEIMVMDEVLAVGDIKFQQKCLGRMGTAASDEGRTVLYVSHNMNTIRQLCTRCIVLSQGKLIFDGDVEGAIQKYLEGEKHCNKVEYELQEVHRPSLDHGRLVHLTNFTFLEKKDAIFAEKEKVYARITWQGHANIDALRLYLPLKTLDDYPVGVAVSEVLGNARTGEENSADIEISFDNLAPGSYYFYLNIIIQNNLGTAHSYDRPDQKIFFEIIDEQTQKFEWKNKVMGNIRFPDIQVRESR